MITKNQKKLLSKIEDITVLMLSKTEEKQTATMSYSMFLDATDLFTLAKQLKFISWKKHTDKIATRKQRKAGVK